MNLTVRILVRQLIYALINKIKYKSLVASQCWSTMIMLKNDYSYFVL